MGFWQCEYGSAMPSQALVEAWGETWRVAGTQIWLKRVRIDLAEACLSFDSLLVQTEHYESCLWQQNRVETWVHMIRYGIQPSVLKRWYSH